MNQTTTPETNGRTAKLVYAGIGSRETPSDVRIVFVELGEYLAHNDVILRSGGAGGADTAFEVGCNLGQGKKEIYLPWKGFNGHDSELVGVTDEALKIGEKYHPAWDKLSWRGKCLIARNSFQVLGKNLDDPVDFIICWTVDGKIAGGTGQALRIAEDYGIPVYNFGNKELASKIKDAIVQNLLNAKTFL